MSNLIRQGDVNLASFGQFGCLYKASSNDAYTGKTVVAIQSLSDTTEVTSVGDTTQTDGSGNSLWSDLNTVTVCCGVTIFGRWESVTIGGAGGSAILYFAE